MLSRQKYCLGFLKLGLQLNLRLMEYHGEFLFIRLYSSMLRRFRGCLAFGYHDANTGAVFYSVLVQSSDDLHGLILQGLVPHQRLRDDSSAGAGAARIVHHLGTIIGSLVASLVVVGLVDGPVVILLFSLIESRTVSHVVGGAGVELSICAAMVRFLRFGPPPSGLRLKDFATLHAGPPHYDNKGQIMNRNRSGDLCNIWGPR